jgi:hypothetical protein
MMEAVKKLGLELLAIPKRSWILNPNAFGFNLKESELGLSGGLS